MENSVENVQNYRFCREWKVEISTFPHIPPVEKLKNTPQITQMPKIESVEKNKFSTFDLTENIHKARFYSLAKKIFLSNLHKNHAFFKNIKAPRLKNTIDKIMCSIYTHRLV